MSTPGWRGAPIECVFCGRPIGPEEEAAGRGSIAAHASCADAALADDAHWDAISEATDDADEPGAGPDRTPRVGCLGVSSGLLLAALLAAARLLGRHA